MVRILTLFILTLTMAGFAVQAQPLAVPPMRGFVNDPADILERPEKLALINDVSSLNARTHAQTAVLIVPTLQGDNLESAATRVFNTWRLGNARRNDGVLILVAWEDRNVRIEVGRGLEATLTNALAGQIIKERMLPWFRAGELTDGIRHGLTGIDAALSGKPLPPATSPSRWWSWLRPWLVGFSYWQGLPFLAITLAVLLMKRKKKTLITLFFVTSCLLTPALAITSDYVPWVVPFLWLSFSLPILLLIMVIIMAFAFPRRLFSTGSGASSGDNGSAWLANQHLHHLSGGDSGSHHSSHDSVSSGDGGSSDGGGSSDNW
ncbi:TPM domain-containing protein [Cronobacter muytjensii]|nr:TPM domain-containing protein [Cronobacter muytjensii]